MSDAPALNPDSEEQISAALEREHIRPAYVFQGKPLWPYTRGMKLIYNQIIDNDTNLFRYLAFVWMLIKRGASTFKEDAAIHVIPAAWDINRFRAEIVDFCDTLTDQDEMDAQWIFTEWLESENKSSVKAGPKSGETDATTLKKTELTPEALHGMGQG